MRRLLNTSALLATLVLGGFAYAAGGPVQGPQQYGPVMDGGDMVDGCDPCADPCGRRHHCHGCRLFANRNQDSGFNCGCNGSYKFPVPPLYTYHWPGMYSAQPMTDYHSPWRFPPLKPYTDEIPVEVTAKPTTHRRVQTVSAQSEILAAPGSTPFSSHVDAMFR